MTVDRKQPNRSYPPARDERREGYYAQQQTTDRSNTGYTVVFLMLLALAVLCVAGYLVVRLLMPDSSPLVLPKFATWTPSPTLDLAAPSPTAIPETPTNVPVSGEASVMVTPEKGYINTLITVTGQGWWPGEPVFVFLRSKDEGDGRGYSYAAAVADDQGNMRTALTFPNELRWMGQEWADVIARGTRSGREASTRFTLEAPTPTPTLPPPTARPTSPATNTPPPTDTPLPTATPTPELVITDWRGEYYANTTLSGEPALVRNDVQIAFDWGEGSPGPGLPVDGFSTRWTRRLRFDEGRYRFVAAADDGLRFRIDGQILVDQWHDQAFAEYTVEVDLAKGRHTLQMEYYENVGGAAAGLIWSRIETPTATPTVEPTAVPSLPEVWHAEYFGNIDLSGQPVAVRDDANLNFEWGTGSPAPDVPVDLFSARWTREIWTPGATYRFVLQADDGVRLWVDGVLLIDEWHVGTGDTYRAEIYMPEGVHRLQVEYYEMYLDAWIHYRIRLVSN